MSSAQELLHRLKLQVAARLLAAAAVGVSEHMTRVSVLAGPKRVRRRRNTVAGRKGSQYTIFTDPSKPGEYPRLRTGIGRTGTTYAPTTPEAVVANGMRIRVGVTESGKHMLILELHRERKGLRDTFRDLKPRLARVIEGA